jgi:hypothetical protein
MISRLTKGQLKKLNELDDVEAKLRANQRRAEAALHNVQTDRAEAQTATLRYMNQLRSEITEITARKVKSFEADGTILFDEGTTEELKLKADLASLKETLDRAEKALTDMEASYQHEVMSLKKAASLNGLVTEPAA